MRDPRTSRRMRDGPRPDLRWHRPWLTAALVAAAFGVLAAGTGLGGFGKPVGKHDGEAALGAQREGFLVFRIHLANVREVGQITPRGHNLREQRSRQVNGIA